jgi:Holliday junction resolvase RusA-like endonuclease
MSQRTLTEGLKSLHLVVPAIPPSVNHYKTPFQDRRGRTHYRVSKAFKAFKWAVAIISAGRQMQDSKAYKVSVILFLGKGMRGDAANFEKAIGDGLEDARVFVNDSRIKRYHIEVARDWQNPRTEILVEVYQQPIIPKLEGVKNIVSSEVSLLSPRVSERPVYRKPHPSQPSRHATVFRSDESRERQSQSQWREHSRKQFREVAR